MRQLIHFFHPDELDPAEWPRAVAGFAFVLITIWLSLAVRWVWAEDPGPMLPRAEHSGQVTFSNGQNRFNALNLSNHAEIQITGMNAEVTLQQSFQNPTDEWLEATYTFPLPDDSAVSRMQVRIGERLIEGKIAEREQAQRTYQKAKAAGKRAALTEQQRPNLFSQQVANIGPGETIEVTLTYQQTARFNAGEFSLRLPTTLTPRYIPGISRQPQEIPAEQSVALSPTGWAAPTDLVADAHRITPPQGPVSHTLGLNVQLDSGLPLETIQSSTHALTRTDNGDGTYQLQLRDGTARMDRDFELTWKPETAATPQAAAFTGQWQGEHFVQVMFLPPALANGRSIARELTLIVDTSGSMAGDSIAQARESALYALNTLTPDDSFNVIEFNSSHHALFSQPAAANTANLNRATQFIKGLQAQGGTEMASALKAAFAQSATGERLSQVVFVTDGAVGNEAGLFKLISQKRGQARLFTVGIGSAPNSYFMRKAAKAGRGAFTHIQAIDEVLPRMQTLLRKLENPAVTDLEIHWPSQLQAKSYPKDLPDLYLGEPLQLIARLGEPPEGEITITGSSGGTFWSRTLTLPANGNTAEPLARLWGRARLDALMEDMALGTDSSARDDLRQQALATALRYRLLSPYTSFIAVEATPARAHMPPDALAPVPNALPAGSLMQSVAYPNTSNGVIAQWLSGLLAGLLALALYRRRV